LYAELVLHGKTYTECRSPLSMGLWFMQFYNEDDFTLPNIKESKVYNVFKDLLAVNWGELSNFIVNDVKNVLLETLITKLIRRF